MNAKNYLEQLQNIIVKIEQKKLQAEELRSIATNISARTGSEKIRGSGRSDKVGNTIVKVLTLENQISDEINHYVEAKNTIINQIESLDNVDYMKMLYMRYVQFFTIDKIAVEMSLCARQISRVHNNALKEFEKLIE